MQVGSILAVPILAIGYAVYSRGWQLPTRLALAGTTAWILAKVVKSLVERGRPDVFLSNVNLRPAWNGLGFPSGHTAVAFAIAAVLTSTLSRRWRIVVWVIAIAAGLLRMYTAAHLPLDVLGGWGLGIAVGSIVEIGWRRLAQPTAEQPDESVLAA